MKNHTDVLNYLADTFQLNNYLEIGVQYKKNNFNLIRVPFKKGVDPDPRACASFVGTSDLFFSQQTIPRQQYDEIFIDGDHNAIQVKKDFENALRHLSYRGFIVLHDTNPREEAFTHVPRDKKGVWNGDVYKFASQLSNYTGIDYCTLPFDNGCTVAWLNGDAVAVFPALAELDWETFISNRNVLLNIVTIDEFKSKLPVYQPLLSNP